MLPHFSVAEPLASVGYIHSEIYSQKDITIDVDSLVSENSLSSVKYLFKQIDSANESLNGFPTTDYANSAESLEIPVAASKVLADIDELIVLLPAFEITVTNVSSFNFQISASGNYRIDWGDGSEHQLEEKTDTALTTYSYTYSETGTYTIRLRGIANGYNTSTYSIGYYGAYSGHMPAILFYNSSNKTKITNVSGSLGKVFGSIDSGNPCFFGTFNGCTSLLSITSDLFDGLSGTMSTDMFAYTFYNCIALNALPDGLFANVLGAPSVNIFKYTFFNCDSILSIPSDLFSGILGLPAEYMFDSTFRSCDGILSIPAGLFSSISGLPAEHMFSNTFQSCVSVLSIPAGLFSNILGAPAAYMFYGTFQACDSVLSIPAGLFSNISGAPAEYMFASLFSSCDDLSGSIPSNLFVGILGTPASFMFYNTFSECPGITSIPAELFAGISGAPAAGMFHGTFNYTGITSLPIGLFGGIRGAPANSMFNSTFWQCYNLTSIPAGFNFGDFQNGAPAGSMFRSTFQNCAELTGSIPAGLFGSFSGSAVTYMFSWTFLNCSKLIGIENGIWDLTGLTIDTYSVFSGMFEGCDSITSAAPTVSATNTITLWDYFSAYIADDVFKGCINMSNYNVIPVAWGGV